MRFGVIGGGFGVDAYLPVLLEMNGVEVAAVADSGSGRLLTRLTDRSLYRSSWHDLLDASIDAVCVVTPPSSHLETVLALISGGKHVLCEKPFGMTPQQSRDMACASARASVVGAVTYQYRFEPGLQALKTLLEDGCIGELRSLDCTWLTSGRSDPRSPWTWRNDVAQGGGVIGAFLSHVVDLIHWVSSAQVQEINASARILVPRRPLAGGSLADVSAEDEVRAKMTLSTGVTATCHVGNCHSQSLGMRIEMIGSKGRIIYSHTPPFSAATQCVELYVGDAAPQRLFAAEQVLGVSAEDTRRPALRQLLERFIRRAKGIDAPDLPSFEDGCAVQRVLHAARQSAATHGSVTC
jgi:predicted dehydrogenase